MQQQALSTARGRILFLASCLFLAFSVVGVRLVDATLLSREGSGLTAQAAQSLSGTSRAAILDRNGELLATSIPTISLYADPARVIEPERTIKALRTVLPTLDAKALATEFASKKRFVWLQRHLTPKQYEQVLHLGLPGIEFQQEERRLYPQGALTAHVLGYADVDNNGLAGIEKYFDATLRAGQSLRLSVDIRLQHILRHEIQTAITDFNAIGGSGMIMDAQNGEILAMVSLPDFDPHDPGSADAEALFNRATLGVYEMGSTLKSFNSALALESGKISLWQKFDATQPIRFGRFTINDFKPENRFLTLPEVFQHSSNIGSARMALIVGGATQREFLRQLGFFEAPKLELPEIGRPLVPQKWSDLTTMTVAFGHGLSISPLQLMRATAAMVNGGLLPEATLLERQTASDKPLRYTRVISEQSSATMRKLLRLVVESGTAKAADAKGYIVGGKTGTAEKTTGKRYSLNARLSSFVGAFPMQNPRYVVFVMVDEPKPNASSHGYATGGWVAAPAIGRIIAQMAPLLGLMPADETDPAIRTATRLIGPDSVALYDDKNDSPPAAVAPAAESSNPLTVDDNLPLHN